jgi:hypothetical protein
VRSGGQLLQRVVLAAFMAAGAARASAQFCSNCIYNSAAPQNAQFNVSSATIRGALTVGSLSVSSITVSTATAGVFIGSGTYLTDLNASQLLLGTVPSAVVAGSYTGITGVGALAAGSLASGFTPVGTALGGSGQNWGSVSANYLPYFSGSGVMGVLAPATGALVYTGSALAYTAAPTLTGTNFSAIPLTALSAGTLPTDVLVAVASLPTIPGTLISGNISGGAASLTTLLPISGLAAGTLPTSIPASSVTVTGVAPGYCGGPTTSCQVQIGTDGRIYTASQYNLPEVGISTGVTTTAALTGNGQSSSPLGVNSSSVAVLNASGYVPDAEIDPALFAVKASSGVNADLKALLAVAYIAPAETFGSSVTITAAGGLLATSSVTASAFFGDGSHLSGVLTAVGNTFTSSTTFTAPMLLSASSITLTGVNGRITSVSSVTASAFFGDGSHLGGVVLPSQVQGVYLPLAGGQLTGWLQTTSSVTIQDAGAGGLLVQSDSVTASAFFGDGSHLTGITVAFPNTTSSSFTVTNAGGILATSSVTASAFFGDGSHLTGIQSAAPSGFAGGDLGGSYPNPFVLQASQTQGFTVAYMLRASTSTWGVGAAISTGDYKGDLSLAAGANITMTGSLAASTAALTLDGATAATIFPHAPLQVYDAFNGDLQAVIQNQSSGNTATGNLIFFSNDASNTMNYVDLGINGGGYSGSANGWFDGPHDGYLYSQGGNMSVGASTAGAHVSLFVGGTLQANVLQQWFSTGTVLNAGSLTIANGGFTVATGTVSGLLTVGALSVGTLTNVSSIQSGANGIASILDAAGNYLLYTSTNGIQSVTSSTGTVFVPAGGGEVVKYGVSAATVTATAGLTSSGGVSNFQGSSVLIGTNSYSVSGAMDYSHGLSSNTWTLVVSTYVTSVATVTFTNAVSSVTYEFQVEQFQLGSTAGGVVMWFNGDTSISNTDYWWQMTGESNNAVIDQGNNASFAIQFNSGAAPAAPGGTSRITGTFRSEFRHGKNVIMESKMTTDNTSGGSVAIVGGGWRGSAPLTSVSFGQVNANNTILSDYKISVWARIGLDNSP